MQRGRRNTEHDTIKEWVGETLIVQSWSSSSSLQSPLPSFFDLNANPRKCSTNLPLEALRSSPYSLSVRTSSALQNGLLFIGECMKNRVTNSASSAAPGSDRTAQGRHSGARTRQLILEGFCLSLGGDTSGAAATLWSLLGAGATIWRVLAQTFWMVFVVGASWRHASLLGANALDGFCSLSLGRHPGASWRQHLFTSSYFVCLASSVRVWSRSCLFKIIWEACRGEYKITIHLMQKYNKMLKNKHRSS